VATPASEPPFAVPAPLLPSSLRVLVVDDNDDGAESLMMLLEFAGHTVEKASSGPEALAAAERFVPHVILLDIGLPGMNGYEVCKRLRRQSSGKTMVVVALTGWGQDEDRERSREAGFDKHMTKPVDHDALLVFLSAVAATNDALANERDCTDVV
jgi:CheY-like chemotaxis protein